MKTTSLEIDELVFEETDEILFSGKKQRNGYINGAFSHVQKRSLLEEILQRESQAVRASSLEVLKEFESIEDELQTI